MVQEEPGLVLDSRCGVFNKVFGADKGYTWLCLVRFCIRGEKGEKGQRRKQVESEEDGEGESLRESLLQEQLDPMSLTCHKTKGRRVEHKVGHEADTHIPFKVLHLALSRHSKTQTWKRTQTHSNVYLPTCWIVSVHTNPEQLAC